MSRASSQAAALAQATLHGTVRPYTRSGQPEQLGLYPYVCAACGKRFEAAAVYKYKITSKGKTRMFCCYNCYFPAEEVEREEYRRRTLGRWCAPNEKTPQERAQARVDACARKVSEWNAKAQAAPDARRRRECERTAARWLAKQVIEEGKLEEVRASDV